MSEEELKEILSKGQMEQRAKGFELGHKIGLKEGKAQSLKSVLEITKDRKIFLNKECGCSRCERVIRELIMLEKLISSNLGGTKND
jgi:hypothetical protein